MLQWLWQVVNRVQKLRKKAGLVSTDAVDVFVGAADSAAPSTFTSMLNRVLETQVRQGCCMLYHGCFQ